MVSLPASPCTISLPPPPNRRSLPVLPRKVSFIPPPKNVGRRAERAFGIDVVHVDTDGLVEGPTVAVLHVHLDRVRLRLLVVEQEAVIDHKLVADQLEAPARIV